MLRRWILVALLTLVAPVGASASQIDFSSDDSAVFVFDGPTLTFDFDSGLRIDSAPAGSSAIGLSVRLSDIVLTGTVLDTTTFGGLTFREFEIDDTETYTIDLVDLGSGFTIFQADLLAGSLLTGGQSGLIAAVIETDLINPVFDPFPGVTGGLDITDYPVLKEIVDEDGGNWNLVLSSGVDMGQRIVGDLSFGGSVAGTINVPEPTTLSMMGLGLLGVAWIGRRRTR